MRTTIIICLFGLVAVAYARPDGEVYTNRFDNINLDEILYNHRLLGGYVNCTLDIGRCTAQGRELKSHIREGLEQNCAKCTPKQRAGTRRVLAHLINHEPNFWNQLKAKYDSAGLYSTRYENELREIRLN